MPFFDHLDRTADPSFFFFPSVYASGLKHFLERERVTGWEIAAKGAVVPYLPEGCQIPTDIRLTPAAPRIEKRVSCLVSYYTEASVSAAYQKLLLSQAWLDWHNDIAEKALADHELREAMARDPSPLSALRGSRDLPT